MERPMAEPELVRAFLKLPAANIADTMGRSCAMSPRIHLMSSPVNPIMSGRALTVKARAGDNLMIHQALDMAEEDDIIVVSNEEDTTRALMGEIMFRYAKFRKIGGIILDGPLRDLDVVAKLDLPVYATGSTPGGPYKEGPGEINVPIACGGVHVNPGDIIVADHDGVIVIPLADAPSVLSEAVHYAEMDAKKVEAAITGTAKREWVMETLKKKNTEFIKGVYGEKILRR